MEDGWRESKREIFKLIYMEEFFSLDLLKI